MRKIPYQPTNLPGPLQLSAELLVHPPKKYVNEATDRPTRSGECGTLGGNLVKPRGAEEIDTSYSSIAEYVDSGDKALVKYLVYRGGVGRDFLRP